MTQPTEPPMWGLRLLLLAGCAAGATLSATTAPWDAQLVLQEGVLTSTWTMRLGRHAVWNPPPGPTYAEFRAYYLDSQTFPPPGAGWTIRVSCHPAEVALGAVAYSWPAAALCGLLYRATRGPRRDVALHCALWAAAGLSAALAACVAFWCALGGWGPPLPGCFGLFGALGGAAFGLQTLRPAKPSSHPLP